MANEDEPALKLMRGSRLTSKPNPRVPVPRLSSIGPKRVDLNPFGMRRCSAPRSMSISWDWTIGNFRGASITPVALVIFDCGSSSILSTSEMAGENSLLDAT